MEDEATEDIMIMAGSDDSELTYSSPLAACRVRLPWLLVTLASGFVYSLIFKHFLSSFSHLLILGTFVPIVMAMGGNTGIQSSTLIIRGMAVGAVDPSHIRRMLMREIIAGLTMGTVCGIGIGIWTYIVLLLSPESVPVSPIFLALTVGLALTCAMLMAATFGSYIPFVFKKLKIDPAVASGPLIIASIDILALLMYFGITLVMVGLYMQLSGGGG
jgi:magnesium transporter